jgi:hypothetical protein
MTGAHLVINILHSSVTGDEMQYTETVHQQFINFQKAYDSVRREVL